MNKFFVVALTALLVVSVSAVAAADDNAHPYHPDISQSLNQHPFRLGVGLDVGVPSGGALELTLHPKADWVRVSAALTYNYLAFGGRASLQLDPLALLRNCPVALYADVQAGFFPQANVPNHSDLPQVGYDYLNLYGVLRFGNARGFHWNFMAGPTFLHVTSGNFQSVVSNANAQNITVGNPTVSGWVVPTFLTGFEAPITF